MLKRFQHISAMRLALATGAFALSALSLNAQAQAGFSTYTANGVNLLGYTSTSYSYTTMQDANFYASLKASAGDADKDGVNDLVEAILAVSPTVTDAYGTANVRVQDLSNFNGKLTYIGSLALVNYLNSVSYAGSNEWSLADSLWTPTLIYFSDGLLTNVQNDYYRIGNDGHIDAYGFVYFDVVDVAERGLAPEDLIDGRDYSSPMYTLFGTKAILADVTSVPEPASVTLLMAGLGVLGAVARRRKQQR
jgi:PEP-CTERM motif